MQSLSVVIIRGQHNGRLPAASGLLALCPLTGITLRMDASLVIDLCGSMTDTTSSTDHILTGVALMLGFCLTAPLLDVAAKLAADTVPVGQITAARFFVQCVLMAPVIWVMGLSLRVVRGQWLALVFRAVFLLVATFCFIAAIRVMPLADALAIVFVAPFIVLLVGKFYLGEDMSAHAVWGLQSWGLSVSCS